MTISTTTPRPIFAYQTMADHWGITSFTVNTPQNGDPNSLTITAESWTGVVGPNRGNIQQLKTTIVAGDGSIAAILGAVGAMYEAARNGGADRPTAMYNALKRALEAAQQQSGLFPGDAA